MNVKLFVLFVIVDVKNSVAWLLLFSIMSADAPILK